MKIFDPILDNRLQRLSKEEQAHWDASWIWYPGQRASHLQSQGLRKALDRCRYVGYPGNFRHPEYHAFFRKRAVVAAKTTIQWQCLSGRTRVAVNGYDIDLTTREYTLEPGEVEILVSIDFSESLPCFIMQGAAFNTDDSWETSLDRKNWQKAECFPAITSPGRSPMAASESVLRVPIQEVIACSNASVQNNMVTFDGPGEVIVDFWYYELGQITLEAKGSTTLQVFAGQSISEVKNEDLVHFEQKPFEPIISPNGSYTLPEACVRFVRIKADGPCTITQLCFDASVTEVEYKGGFECSDERLNEIWLASAATVHTCMHDFFLDAIYRDALPWGMDGCGAIAASDCVFYDRVTARQQILSQTLPQNADKDDLGSVYLDFAMYSVLGFEYDYMVTGDKAFIARYCDRIEEIVDIYQSFQNARGYISGVEAGGRNFFPDWAALSLPIDLQGTPAYAQMLLMHIIEFAAQAAQLAGKAKKAEVYAKSAAQLRSSIREDFWDVKKRAFINGYDRSGKKDEGLSMYAQVFGILFDLCTGEEAGGMIEHVVNNHEYRAKNVSLSQAWELQAYAKAGKMDLMLSYIKRVWGYNLDLGYNRILEDIDITDGPIEALEFYGRKFGLSHCHAVLGAGPVIAMARGVLGVQPSEPGYAHTVIAPQLGSLKWAKGAVPTPQGCISVDLNENTGRVSLPSGITAELRGYVTADGKSRIIGPCDTAINKTS